jgi:L-Ala-D/L-Glu epimerase / N-acetyl-D-glutamate racemase
VRLDTRTLRLRFARPVRTARATLHERELLVVSLTDDAGLAGHGEAAPLEPYDGVQLTAVRDALHAFGPVLAAAQPGDDPDAVLGSCRAVRDLPQALAAVDLALWDLAGRRAGRPVSALLRRDPAQAIEVNATIGADAPDEAANEAAAAVRDGFRTIKVKVGTTEDRARVGAVRAAVGPDVALRVDANGAWEPEEAVRAIGELAAHGVELVEEPVHGVRALRAVRERVDVPIAMDETANDPQAPGSGATDAVCLKIAACGGISGLLDRAEQARAAGSDVYVASTYDGPLGIAAGLHAAAILGPRRACGLATLRLFAGEPADHSPRDGHISVPPGPGLGAPAVG